MDTASTVAAISTPLMTGGIGVIRISGPLAVDIAGRVFLPAGKKTLEELKGYQAAYGKMADKTGPIDEGVALVFKAPHSYTGEDVVELSCHGGIHVLGRVLGALLDAGAQPAGAGEFSKRAFLNGKMDLTQAEAVADIIFAQGDASLRAALSMREGTLFQKASALCDTLIGTASHIAAFIDFPEEDLPELEVDHLEESLLPVLQGLRKLKESYQAAKTVKNGVSAAVVGKPNTGKSTLMNALCGEERSIVADLPGTTRDVVEETVELGGILIRFADTAGIRTSEDAIESEGVRRSLQKLAAADLVLCVFDASRPLSGEDEQLLNAAKARSSIAVINKTDLPIVADLSKIESAFPKSVRVCARTGEGMEDLRREIIALCGVASFDPSAPFVANERQLRCVLEAAERVEGAITALKQGFTLDAVGVDIQGAIEALLTLTGRTASEEIVNEVFSRFCIGK